MRHIAAVLVVAAFSSYAEAQNERLIAEQSERIRLNPKDAVAYSIRGSAWVSMKEYDKGLSDLNEAIRLNPKRVMPYVGRGSVWLAKVQYDKAISDYSEIIRLDPEDELGYLLRGHTWNLKGEYKKAIADVNQAIRIETHAAGFALRGDAWRGLGDYKKSIADYSRAIRTEPREAKGFQSFAWLLATCPDVNYRDGKKAVEYAKRAFELSVVKDEDVFGTLAAAYAESGDFKQAIKWQEKAIKFLEKENDRAIGDFKHAIEQNTKATDLTEKKIKTPDFRSRLELYIQGKPYREEKKK